jgi:hypothetical protein
MCRNSGYETCEDKRCNNVHRKSCYAGSPSSIPVVAPLMAMFSMKRISSSWLLTNFVWFCTKLLSLLIYHHRKRLQRCMIRTHLQVPWKEYSEIYRFLLDASEKMDGCIFCICALIPGRNRTQLTVK